MNTNLPKMEIFINLNLNDMKELKFARQCTNCGDGMNDGIVINGGEEYYCTHLCLSQNYNDKQINNMDIGDDNSDSYYTEWDSDSDMEYMLIDGKLKYIGED